MPTFREILEKLKINAAKVLRGKDPEDCLPVVSKDYNDLIDVLKELDSNGTVTSVSIAPANGFSGSSSGGATPALTINLQDANTSQDGKLIASDWNTFNNKQNSLVAGDNITIDTTDPLAPIINSTGAVPINSNIVAKGTGTSITESQIFDDGTNVGINTEFPEAKLHIQSDSNLEENLSLNISNSDGESAFLVDDAKNVMIGDEELELPATDGFLYLPTTPGAPVGSPTAKVGTLPVVIDSVNDVLYFFSNSTWHSTASPGSSGWGLSGNTLVGGEVFGSLNNFDTDIIANGKNALKLKANGEIKRSGQPYDSLETTKNNDFNNTTSPLTIFLSDADYPHLSNSQKLCQNIYIQIENEIMYCSDRVNVAGGANFTLSRGMEGTVVAAHVNSLPIYFIIPYAIYQTNEGFLGLGTSTPSDSIELHLKDGFHGFMTMWRDDLVSSDISDPRGKGRCAFFFSEVGGLMISAYDDSGNPVDPTYQLELGKKVFGTNLGIKLHGDSKILFSEASGDAAIIQGTGTGIKFLGSGGYADMQGYNGNDLRIATASNASSLPTKLRLMCHDGVAGTWVDMMRLNDTNGANSSDLSLLPVSAGNLLINGLVGWSGTYLTGDARTATVTKGIITNVA